MSDQPQQPSQPSDPNKPITQQFQHQSVAAASVPEKVAKGVYCTGQLVLDSPKEFIIDFLQGLTRQRINLRYEVVVTPQTMAELANAFKQNLDNYTTTFGPPPPLPPPPPNQPRPTLQEIYENFKVPEEIASGAGANTVLIGHSMTGVFSSISSRGFIRTTLPCRVAFFSHRRAGAAVSQYVEHGADAISAAISANFQQQQQRQDPPPRQDQPPTNRVKVQEDPRKLCRIKHPGDGRHRQERDHLRQHHNRSGLRHAQIKTKRNPEAISDDRLHQQQEKQAKRPLVFHGSWYILTRRKTSSEPPRGTRSRKLYTHNKPRNAKADLFGSAPWLGISVKIASRIIVSTGQITARHHGQW